MFGQDLPTSDFEIIVVVDGSTDGTAQALRELKPPCTLRVIEQLNGGPSAARNSGIRVARGDLLLFIDDDIVCSPGLFRWHVEAHADVRAAVVYGPISMAPEAPPSVLKYANATWFQDYYGRVEAQHGLNLPKDDYLISNSSIPRAELVECGGFDETMKAKEDYELGLRLWKKGLQFKYLPQAKAYEFFQKPIQYVLRRDGKAFGETDVLLTRKHLEYRPYATLAALGKMAWWKRQARRILTALPFSPDGVLNPALWICDKFCRYSVMRTLSRHLLGFGRGLVVYPAAARKIGSWQALENEFGRRLPVLLYHHVGPERPGTIRGLTVSPKRFERHVRWLALRGFKGICPADWLRWRQDGKSLPAKPILFTFDDGYADLAEYALPVLRRHGFGAAVYIVTGQLGGTNAWDAARSCAPFPLMATEQIRYWASQGFEFGAHSRTHADLRTLSAQELSEEVLGSGKDLEAILGSWPVSFAHPYGFHNQAVDDCVRGAFDLAFIADDGKEGLNYLDTDPHQLLRTMVQSDDSQLAMEFRSRWGHYPFYNLLARIRVRFALRTRLKRLLRRNGISSEQCAGKSGE